MAERSRSLKAAPRRSTSPAPARPATPPLPLYWGLFLASGCLLAAAGFGLFALRGMPDLLNATGRLASVAGRLKTVAGFLIPAIATGGAAVVGGVIAGIGGLLEATEAAYLAILGLHADSPYRHVCRIWNFIEAINEIGPHYKERIYREYLGIEPPPGFADAKL